MPGRVNFKALALKLLILAGLLVFSRGFLPPTRTKLGVSTDAPDVKPKFNRVIFMVVDALRSDFLFSSSKSPMYNTHEMLRNGYGYAFTAYSDPPTVTLPRIKGLTTGASPNFLDAIINVAESDSASTLKNQDSWIYQLHAHNKSLHMFGDDTWLKLFPDIFTEFDATSSFYVSDFTEVDNNVTRHLPEQLAPRGSTSHNNWDALILHYLGLDHIGHKSGPNSIDMPDKLKEMDQIIKTIFDSLDDSTLFVLAGDHGMNDVGNHGGASKGETSAALAFFAKKFRNKLSSPLPNNDDFFYYSNIKQVDLVTTLAILLGFPIPKNSLGVFIPEFLSMWTSEEDKDIILRTNCYYLDVETSAANIGTKCTWDGLRTQQAHLMRTSSEHIVSYMAMGIAILAFTTTLSAAQSIKELKGLEMSRSNVSFLIWWLVIPSLYFLGMMGSSTVEEEHYIWYWGLSGLLATLFVAIEGLKGKLMATVLFICFRIIRGWNTPGQKWTFLPSSSTTMKQYPSLLWMLIFLTFALINFAVPSKKFTYRHLLTLVASVITAMFKYFAIYYPLNLPWMIDLARTALGTAVLDICLGNGMETGMLLWFIIQTKLENIPIWIPLIIGRSVVTMILRDSEKSTSNHSSKTIFELFIGLITLCLEYTSFFAMGGSNSLATIDLSNAYNGVSGYNIPLVALLTYFGNWSGSIFWTLGLTKSLSLQTYRAWFYSVSCLGVSVACFVLREHLFIWTVFSPKFLYVGAWLFFHEILAKTLTTLLC